ncbi:MAG: hypothetical protein F6K30_18090 [Cyanothece sp. SIO2G6]|nr:hypothetical protein [Cyanothece sp. SIO2G6]
MDNGLGNVHDPPVIILDEPTVGLDPRQIIDVRNLIKSLAGDHTIILSTHILSEVKMTCDRITIINRGQVVATNHPDDLVNEVRGGVQYELDIAGATEVATSKLQQLDSVASVSVQSQSQDPDEDKETSQRSLLLVQLNPGSDDGPALARTLIEAGLNLYGMQRTQASLEDVFLNLTATDVVSMDQTVEQIAEQIAELQPDTKEPAMEAKSESEDESEKNESENHAEIESENHAENM